MTGDLFVDGIDVYEAYGIGIEHDGLNSLIAFNALREPRRNDWPEEDGIEVDLTEPKLQGKSVTLTMHGIREYGVEDFLGLLDERAYHVFEFRNIGITRTLRLVSMPSRNTIQPLKVFQLEFAEDNNPFDGYIREDPQRLPENNETYYKIDDKLLSDYGIFVQYGVLDELLKQPPVKQGLLIDPVSIDGRIYDSEVDVVFKERSVSLKCTLKCNKDIFWKNWMSFFYDITRPNERRFYFSERDQDFPCYYQSCSVTKFNKCQDDNIWCDFTVTFCFTNINIGEVWRLLAVVPQGIIELDDTGLMVDTTYNGYNPS